jgi:hypothetical protein
MIFELDKAHMKFVFGHSFETLHPLRVKSNGYENLAPLLSSNFTRIQHSPQWALLMFVR